VWMPEKRVRTTPKGPKPDVDPLRNELRNLRAREARRRRWKPYQVFPDKTLDAIVEARPRTAAELLELPGMGPARIEKFSSAILEIVSRQSSARPPPSAG
jgi:ATP-dependent DNA helicase RecQ